MVVQAIRAQAHANWAVTAYAAGSVLVALALVNRPKLRWIAVGLNGIVAVVFPLLFINGDSLRLPDGRYLAARYLGPAALSQEAAAVARANGVGILVSDERGIMADLFHTLRDTDLSFRAVPPDGAPKSFYQASFPLAADAGRVLLITRRQTECAERPVATIEPEAGIYRGRSYGLYLTDAACVTR